LQAQLPFLCKSQQLVISAQRAIFWEAQKTLLLADLHLGKAGHFRKAGIPLPVDITINDLKRLEILLKNFQPTKCIFLGDLFHSDFNKELLLFKAFIKKYNKVKFILVKGNHDVISDVAIKDLGISTIHNVLEMPPFQFTHYPQVDEQLYNMAGHLHPGYRLRGQGRQSLRMPVFYFGEKQAILPAFGSFSGKALIEAKKGDTIFGVIEEALLKIPIQTN